MHWPICFGQSSCYRSFSWCGRIREERGCSVAIALNLEPRAVPLTRLESGTYRVTGTRISLDQIIEYYKDGASPEDVVDALDSVRLSDVYVIISYYLEHKIEVEQYL